MPLAFSPPGRPGGREEGPGHPFSPPAVAPSGSRRSRAGKALLSRRWPALPAPLRSPPRFRRLRGGGGGPSFPVPPVEPRRAGSVPSRRGEAASPAVLSGPSLRRWARLRPAFPPGQSPQPVPPGAAGKAGPGRKTCPGSRRAKQRARSAPCVLFLIFFFSF